MTVANSRDLPHWVPLSEHPARGFERVTWVLAAVMVAALWAYTLLATTPEVDAAGAGLFAGVVLVAPLAFGLSSDRRSSGGWGVTPGMLLVVGLLVAPVVGWPENQGDVGRQVFGWVWVGVAMLVLVQVVRDRAWRPSPRLWPIPDDTVVVLAHGYLVVGSAWLAIHMMGWRPLGFVPEIVELTAVHFHFAGFAALLIAREVRARAKDVAPVAANWALGLVAVAPPVIAVGFSFATILQAIGAALLTAGLWTIAWLLWQRVAPSAPDLAERVLLRIAAISVVVPMFLATQWALANLVDIPALSIPDMARTHGALNAMGFTLPALLALGHLRHTRPIEVRRPAP